MASIRRVALLTTNPHKAPEYTRNFARYGVEVKLERPCEALEDGSVIPDAVRAQILQLLNSNANVVAVLKDDTALLKHGTQERATITQLELVDNFTRLTVFTLNPTKDDVVTKAYTHSTKGYIDLTKKTVSSAVFGWDDVFVLQSVGMTYYELKLAHSKISSRDMVLSAYIKDRFYYKQRQDLSFNPQKQSHTIDFGNSVADFVRNNEYLSNPIAQQFGVSGIFRTVVNQGLFFRSPINRREKNYWYPGLNAGIPLVPKKDPVHEITFMAHDFGHFLIPDLIYTGYEHTEMERLVYVSFRMMSEAITMVFADMAFVDTLRRAGFEYNWNARKIYPVFQATGLDFEDPHTTVAATLKKICQANIDFCMRGSDAGWKKLMKHETEEEREHANAVYNTFSEKYVPFLEEDYKWTIRNYQNMSQRREELKRWWDSVKHLRALSPSLRMYSVSEYVAVIEKRIGRSVESLEHNEDIIDVIFETLWSETIAPIFDRVTPTTSSSVASNSNSNSNDYSVPFASANQILFNSFLRYVIGQSAIFSAYSSVAESAVYRDSLHNLLKYTSSTNSINTEGPTLSLEHVNNALAFYSDYVQLLQSKNLLTTDDATTFKEVYPLFEPFFVFYDEKSDYYPTLDAVYRSVYSILPPTHKRVVICGAPGSGKGTQCEMMAAKYGLVHVSTGDLLREEVAKKSDVGLRAQHYMDSGLLVPDSLINSILLARLALDDCKAKGWILDGYPRSDSNNVFLIQQRICANVVIFLDVDDELALERQCGRVKDPLTGKVYHLKFAPPENEEVAKRVIQRATDNLDKARIRLQTFHTEMDGAAKWFDAAIVHHVDGSRNPEETFALIDAILTV